MNLDTKLQQLREQYKTATETERKLIKCRAQLIMWAKEAQEKTTPPEVTVAQVKAALF